MKELTQTEVQTVSGAGALADALGNAGTVAGTALKFLGMKNSVANGKTLGNNVGLLIESAYGAISSGYKFFFDK